MRRSEYRSLRIRIVTLCGSVVIYCVVGSLRAEPFMNLGFEDATIGTPAGHSVPASQALPDWTNSYEAQGLGSSVWYDTLTLGSPCISIYDGVAGNQAYLCPYQPLAGNYSVVLGDGTDGFGHFYDAWISQTGQVPSDARSLMFETDMTACLDRFVVSLNGTVIPMRPYSEGVAVNSAWGPIETFIGDISAFTNQQDVELRFTVLANPYDSGIVDLDAIQFSSIVVPEPSSLVLLAVGILSLAAYCRRRRNRAT